MNKIDPNIFDSPPGSHGDFYVSTDKALLNLQWIESRLRASYWGDWITTEDLAKRIANSICFGLYRNESSETEEGPI